MSAPRESLAYEVTLHLIDGSEVRFESDKLVFLAPSMTFLVPYQEGSAEHIAIPVTSIVKAVSRFTPDARPASTQAAPQPPKNSPSASRKGE